MFFSLLYTVVTNLTLSLRGLEVVAGAALGHLHVTLAAGAGGLALDGLDGPVEATAGGAGVRAGSTALPLQVPGVLSAATAQHVSAAVASSEGGGSLSHISLSLSGWIW